MFCSKAFGFFEIDRRDVLLMCYGIEKLKSKAKPKSLLKVKYLTDTDCFNQHFKIVTHRRNGPEVACLQK